MCWIQIRIQTWQLMKWGMLKTFPLSIFPLWFPAIPKLLSILSLSGLHWEYQNVAPWDTFKQAVSKSLVCLPQYYWCIFCKRVVKWFWQEVNSWSHFMTKITKYRQEVNIFSHFISKKIKSLWSRQVIKLREVQWIFVTWCASQSYNPHCRFIINI